MRNVRNTFPGLLIIRHDKNKETFETWGGVDVHRVASVASVFPSSAYARRAASSTSCILFPGNGQQIKLKGHLNHLFRYSWRFSVAGHRPSVVHGRPYPGFAGRADRAVWRRRGRVVARARGRCRGRWWCRRRQRGGVRRGEREARGFLEKRLIIIVRFPWHRELGRRCAPGRVPDTYRHVPRKLHVRESQA